MKGRWKEKEHLTFIQCSANLQSIFTYINLTSLLNFSVFQFTELELE